VIPTPLYDRLQRGFPLEDRPYRALAPGLGIDEQALLAALARGLEEGRISRIGAVFAPNVIGASTLAALAVAPERLEAVARQVGAREAVSHNYAREGHRYNLWFVAGARDRGALDRVLEAIRRDTGCALIDLPMEREYHIDLGFSLTSAASPRTPRAAVARPSLDDDDWRLIGALEEGLAPTPRPYDDLARRCGLAPRRVLERLGQWLESGVIRRLGAVLHHRRLGYTRNLMCVWDWPDAQVDAVGERLARLAPVNLCYRRTRRLPDWPYNLFVMLHPRDAGEAERSLQLLAQTAAPPRLVLPGVACYKQRGMRYAGSGSAPSEGVTVYTHFSRHSRESGNPWAFPASVDSRLRGNDEVEKMCAYGSSEGEGAKLGALDRRIIDTLQRGFPICPRPYAAAAQALGCDEATLLARIERLLAGGWLTRFGPLFQIERAGGRFVLCAAHAPAERLEAVIAAINAQPEVAHNYERGHHLNLWFVLAVAHAAAVPAVLARIEAAAGVEVLPFPKEREFFVNLYLPAGDAPAVELPDWDALPAAAIAADPARDHALIRASQSGLPLCAAPYQALAETLGCGEAEVLQGFAAMRERGLLRRIAAVPNHYALGWRANAMTVWDVDDAQVDALGEAIGALPFVSHCYRRPRRLPRWPYNLFAMVHARERDEAQPQIDQIERALGAACRGHDVLWSTRLLKKTGLRLVEGPGPHPRPLPRAGEAEAAIHRR
jgi:DNA-binding Lrp family transcriptional regulator